MIKTGSDFSGVGAFDQALQRLGIEQDKLFACDIDKYTRQTYVLNFGEPKYYPKNVYEREIPKESLDIYMTSPPCQSFSLAGKRQGENSDKGVLFYNSHEFIVKNKPRYFIFENVKGLLSDDNGKTFQKWIDYLGGKSVNGNFVIFPHEESVPYHVYYQVMNAKHYGVPQNRERIFIIGIRDDADNEFSFPKPFHLVKRLKDVLESEVDEKYFLSDKMTELLTYQKKGSVEIANINKGGQKGSVADINGKYIGCLSATDYKLPKLVMANKPIVAHKLSGGKWDKMHEQSRRVYDVEGVAPAMHTCGVGGQEAKIFSPEVFQLNPSLESGGKQPFQHNRVYDTRGVMTTLDTDSGRKNILIPEATKKGYATAYDGDSFYLDRPHQKRGVVQKNMTSTIKTSGNDLGVFTQNRIRKLTPTECFRLMDFN